MKNYDYLSFINHYRNDYFKTLVYKLAEMNDIKIVEDSEYVQYYSFIPDIAIVAGELHLKTAFYENALHELCHILVVEPDLRHHITRDTESAYKYLNSNYPENKANRRESTTFALQDKIYKEYYLKSRVNSDFYSGNVGMGSDMKDEWKNQLENIDYINYKGIDIDRLYVPEVYKLSEKEPEPEYDVMIMRVRDTYINQGYTLKDIRVLSKAIYSKGYFSDTETKNILPSEVMYWCYDF